MSVQNIEIELIRSPGRIRKTDADNVTRLVASIKEVGLLNPVTVAPAKIDGGDGQIDGFHIVAGMHRYTALVKLEYREIPCIVLDLGEQERILAECDENLCVFALTPSDEAKFTARRKEAYLALHPDAGHGKATANKDAKSASLSFADDQAEKTGKSKRAIQDHASRGENIMDEALDVIRGTALDKGTYLDKLKKIPPQKQIARAKADLANHQRKLEEKAESAKRAKDEIPEVESDKDEQEDAPRPPSPFANLEREALEDDLSGALDRIKERDATIESLTAEIERMKLHIADLSSENRGAVISKLERQRVTLKGSLRDQQTATKREEFKRKRAEEERDAAVKSLESQIIPL